MAKNKRVNVKAILADSDLRRKLMVSTIQATQAREGIDTSPEQADRAYYVVSEGERATFFALRPFRGAKKGETDRRNEVFVRSIRGETKDARFDVARRDFGLVESSVLAFKNFSWLTPVFRRFAPLVPQHGRTRSGLNTTEIVNRPGFSETPLLEKMGVNMGRPSRYSPEVRERAVRMVFEHQGDYDSQWAALASIASKIGCTTETLRKWVRQAERDRGQRAGLTTDGKERLKELERENRELKRANEILKKASAFFAQAELDRRGKW